VIHVLDASRSVSVVCSLLNPKDKPEYVADILEEYEEMREEYYSTLQDRKYLTLEKATSKRFKVDFEAQPVPPVPKKKGITVIEKAVADVVPFIDWDPFFQTWELRGKYPNRGYPKIFNDEKVGAEAKKLYDDAQKMIKEIVEKKSMTLKGVVGLFDANRSEDGEDVEVFEDASRSKAAHKFCMLRQQAEWGESGASYFSQADFIAPRGEPDHMGMFAVSCHGAEAVATYYETQNDDFSKIMSQALADRFVEAFAEVVHRDIRKEHWGYAPAEDLSLADLLKVKYQGIRPAPGYPSQPDHLEKRAMWDAIQPDKNAGITLSETLSMIPAASVCALVFAHPSAQYFAVGQVTKDQVQSYAKRKNMSLEDCEKWMSPSLNYDRD